MKGPLKGAPLYYNRLQPWDEAVESVNDSVTPIFDQSNESDMTTINFTTEVPVHPKPCQHLLYLEIPNSRLV